MNNNNRFLKAEMRIFLLLFIVIFFNIPFLNAQTCTDNFQCGSHQYCEKAIGNCLGIGICADRPEPNRVGGPSVCGCDGQTYSNRSIAGFEGVNIAYIGECQIAKPVANLATNPYSQNWYNPNWQNWYYPPYFQNWYSPPNWQNLYHPSYSQTWYSPPYLPNLYIPNWQNLYNPPYLQNLYSPPNWQSWYNPY